MRNDNDTSVSDLAVFPVQPFSWLTKNGVCTIVLLRK